MAQYTFIPHINLIAYRKKTAEVERRIYIHFCKGLGWHILIMTKTKEVEKKKKFDFIISVKVFLFPILCALYGIGRRKVFFHVFYCVYDESPIFRVRKLRLSIEIVMNEYTQQTKRNKTFCVRKIAAVTYTIIEKYFQISFFFSIFVLITLK